MPSAPQQPQQSQFYNVVCGGTWLNREQFSSAVMQSKTEQRLYTETVDILLKQNILAQEKTQVLSATVREVNFGLTDVLPKPLRTIVDNVLGFVAAQLPFLRPTVAVLAPDVALTKATLAAKAAPTSSSAIAQLLAYFFGMTKEAKPTKAVLDDQALFDREQEALKQDAYKTIFNTNAVQSSSGTQLNSQQQRR
jgi:hypothetical protein